MENEEVHEELEQLRQENEDLRRANRAMLIGYKAGGGLAALVALGPGLVKAACNYFERAKPGEPAPPRESAELFAAIVRRVIAVGALGLLVAAVPAGLLWRQNGLIADQNEFFQEQNAKIQKQLDDQAADTLLVRKNELLRTIYETKECDVKELPEGQQQCPPLHPLRLRQEAVVALVRLAEEANLIGADLIGANLRGATLFDVDLTGVNLSLADLKNASFVNANLNAAFLVHANLTGANLRGANLTGAILESANLTGANLRGANLTGAFLVNANLRGAGLRYARNLAVEQLLRTTTCGDSETELPEGIPRPDHWLDRPWKPVDPPEAGCSPEGTTSD